jgi:hypothetical protein
MSMTNTDPNKVEFFPKFDWPRVLNPKMKFPQHEDNLEAVIKLEQESVRQIKQAFADNPNDIAAIIIEPIQGEGGDNHFRPEFLKKLRELADENDAPADIRRSSDRGRNYRNYVGSRATRRNARYNVLRQKNAGMRNNRYRQD